jgi:hypothetical protein
MTDWQPIGSAPKDGTPVRLRWKHGAIGVGYKVAFMWCIGREPGKPPLGSQCEDEGPAEWMPITDAMRKRWAEMLGEG